MNDLGDDSIGDGSAVPVPRLRYLSDDTPYGLKINPDKSVDVREGLSSFLRPVISRGEIKTAVISIISEMPNDENTHRYMLYFLRTLDNPAILEADVGWLEAREELKRTQRKMKVNMKTRVLAGLGLLAGAAAAGLFSLLAKLFGMI